MWNTWCVQRVHRNRNPLSFLFHLRWKQYQFWRCCGLKKRRSRQVFKTLVKLVILHYQNEESCWKHTGPSHYMLQLRVHYIRVSIHCKERNIINVLFYGNEYSPSPVAARSRAWVCGSSLAAIAGSSLAGGMDFCLLSVVCCQVEVSALGWSLVQRSPTEYGVSVWMWS